MNGPMAPGIGGSMTPAPGHIPDASGADSILATDSMEKALLAQSSAGKGNSFGLPMVPDFLNDHMEPERLDPTNGMPIGPNYGTLMVDRTGHQKYSLERERLKALKEQMQS